MKCPIRIAAASFLLVAGCFSQRAWGAETDSRPYGIAQRIPWTTSRITGSPDAPSPYKLTPAFPKLTLKNPVDAETAPGTGRMFVLELGGRLVSFPINADAQNTDVALDLAKFVPKFKEAYGLTFHPGYRTNHYVYLCYVQTNGLPDGTHVSRFKVNDTQPPTIDPASEAILITWLSGGHNGGCLKFGPDGYLYISTGDGAGPNPPDTLETGQDISDLLSSILRIDVDHPPAGKPYRVPTDNPFVKQPGARPEIWAYGLRNPWKMCFDQKSGQLWVGDVGWELWEMVYLIQRAGNYGWSISEGTNPIKPDGKRGPTPILPPVISLPHSEAASITGGFFYHGKRLPDLVGAYIYGDWATGKMWALRYADGKVASNRELLTSTLQIICFAVDEAGELYTVDFNAGGFYVLEPNSAPDTSKSFPRRLSETGVFSSVAKQSPAPGVVPYSINAEPWADHAIATRYVAFPESTQLTTNKEKWIFPKDSVLAKTLALEMETGNPASLRRMETQVLHFDGTNWQCYSYRWNEEQTDATLVGTGGEDRACVVVDQAAPGGKREQTWHYHSRAECLRCHNPWSGNALAYNFPQLNRDHQYEHGAAEQARTLAHIGLLPAPSKKEAAVKLANPQDTAANLAARARSYLHVNCAQCHRVNAGGTVATILNVELKPNEMHALAEAPLRGTFAIPEARVIAPGDPFRSVLYYRIATAGQGHMPHIGSKLVDVSGVNLIHDWIQSLSDTNAATNAKAELETANAHTLQQICNDTPPSPKAQTKLIDQLLASTTGALALSRAMLNHAVQPAIEKLVVERAIRHSNVLVRDLFEPFVPDSERPHKLGTTIKPQTILALHGDAANGSRLFFQEGGAQCQQCHRAQGRGRDFGPDLTQIGRKYTRAQLLENIIAPSKTIDPAFVSYQVETQEDMSYTGFIVKKSATEIVLKDANLNEIHIPMASMKTQRAQSISAMPEGLLQNLTAQEAADLVEFLATLK